MTVHAGPYVPVHLNSFFGRIWSDLLGSGRAQHPGGRAQHPHSAFGRFPVLGIGLSEFMSSGSNLRSAFISVIRGQNFGFPAPSALHRLFQVYEFRLSVLAARSARNRVLSSFAGHPNIGRAQRLTHGTQFGEKNEKKWR